MVVDLDLAYKCPFKEHKIVFEVAEDTDKLIKLHLIKRIYGQIVL